MTSDTVQQQLLGLTSYNTAQVGPDGSVAVTELSVGNGQYDRVGSMDSHLPPAQHVSTKVFLEAVCARGSEAAKDEPAVTPARIRAAPPLDWAEFQKLDVAYRSMLAPVFKVRDALRSAVGSARYWTERGVRMQDHVARHAGTRGDQAALLELLLLGRAAVLPLLTTQRGMQAWHWRAAQQRRRPHCQRVSGCVWAACWTLAMWA